MTASRVPPGPTMVRRSHGGFARVRHRAIGSLVVAKRKERWQMSDDGGAQMKSRLRADLGAAMKAGRKHEVALIRELIAAIDNAEAAPGRTERVSLVRHDFHSGSAEVARLVLSKEQVRNLLLTEIEKREQAAAEFGRVGEAEGADALRTEALLAKRYVEE
jgi:uncharacterized protein